MSDFDLVKAVSSAVGRGDDLVGKVLSAFSDLALKELGAGGRVSLFGLGMLAPRSTPGTDGPELKGRDLAARLAEATGIEQETVERCCEAVPEQTGNALVQKGTVRFGLVGSLHMETIKARVNKDEKSGARLLSQPARSIVFTPAQAATEGAEPLADFRVDPSLSETLEYSGGASILLAFPELDWFAKTIDFHFQKAGWKTQVSQGIIDALQKLDAGATHLVIVDSDMKSYQRVCEAVKRRRGFSLIPLMILFPKTFNLDLPSEFMICGDEHVVQPFEVKKLLSIADSELARSLEEESIFEQQVLFQFPTDDASIERANEFAHKLFESSGLKEEDVVAMAAAIREAIGNACQHGNRYRRDKKVECLYLLDKEKVTVMVKDQGQGFDHQKYVRRGMAGNSVHAARERHKEGKLGGLGIMLMLKCTDKLEYNDIGNSITLTKYVRKPEQPPASVGDGAVSA